MNVNKKYKAMHLGRGGGGGGGGVLLSRNDTCDNSRLIQLTVAVAVAIQVANIQSTPLIKVKTAKTGVCR